MLLAISEDLIFEETALTNFLIQIWPTQLCVRAQEKIIIKPHYMYYEQLHKLKLFAFLFSLNQQQCGHFGTFSCLS